MPLERPEPVRHAAGGGFVGGRRCVIADILDQAGGVVEILGVAVLEVDQVGLADLLTLFR